MTREEYYDKAIANLSVKNEKIDYYQAILNLEKSMTMKYKDAFFLRGYFYMTGEGLTYNEKNAQALINFGEKLGSLKSRFYNKILKYLKDFEERDEVDSELVFDLEKSRDEILIEADNNDSVSIELLIFYYIIGPEKDIDKAIFYAVKGKLAGSARSLFYLTKIYARYEDEEYLKLRNELSVYLINKGFGLAFYHLPLELYDYSESKELLTTASYSCFNPVLECILGEVCLRLKLEEESYRYLMSSYNLGYINSVYYLGSFYLEPTFMAYSVELAKQYFKEGSDQGLLNCTGEFGVCLYKEKNYEDALVYLEKAAIQSYPIEGLLILRYYFFYLKKVPAGEESKVLLYVNNALNKNIDEGHLFKALIYYYGIEVARDLEITFEELDYLIKKGNKDAITLKKQILSKN
jgi:TPR repeat protein